jgi:hypothetical protein
MLTRLQGGLNTNGTDLRTIFGKLATLPQVSLRRSAPPGSLDSQVTGMILENMPLTFRHIFERIRMRRVADQSTIPVPVPY